MEKNSISDKFAKILSDFYKSYKGAALISEAELARLFKTFLSLMKEQLKNPYEFAPFHKQIRAPFDYYTFGLDFVRPIIDLEHSSVLGKESLAQIKGYLKAGHNVVLLSNHQTEADPQAISVLEPELGEKMIYVAGERVITDPMAVPFSMGCNLLCIYSKRYIDNPPELKLQKQLHNKKTMELMSELLKEGGKCIYVAPSGGRDRRNEEGIIEVASFDPQSIEMFYLMAKRAKTPTHFFTLSLRTYDLLPPPETIQVELGEERKAKRAGVHLYFGKEIDMESFPVGDKHLRREKRSTFIYEQVKSNYKKLGGP